MLETYQPKHRGEYKEEREMCTICRNRPVANQGGSGLLGVLCIVCYYEY